MSYCVGVEFNGHKFVITAETKSTLRYLTEEIFDLTLTEDFVKLSSEKIIWPDHRGEKK